MSTVEMYGELQSEKLANDNIMARQIVKEINNFGISDRQRMLIIYCLSLELEKIDEMKCLTKLIKDLRGDDIFVSKVFGGEDNEEEKEE